MNISYFLAVCTLLVGIAGPVLSQDPRMKVHGISPGHEGGTIHFVRFTESGIQQLDSAVIRQGKFELSLPVDQVSPIVARLASIQTVLILEAGDITMTLSEIGSFHISGGHYNTKILGFGELPDYRKAQTALFQLTDGAGVGAVMGTEREWEAVELFLKAQDVKADYLNQLFYNDPDPIVKAITAIMNELQPDAKKAMEVLEGVADQFAADDLLWRRIKAMYAQQQSVVANRQRAMLGDRFTDFTAHTIAGDPVRLAPLVLKNRYTLVQFWASWCGPCRKEIPELKVLYDRYRAKGLEIISFSLDQNRNSWEKASEVENIPWYNLSDLKAFESEVAKAYPVMGIPANVIIDRRGTIVAVNLLGQELEDKIHELFD